MLFLLCVMLWISPGFALDGDIGKFWQLSDVHFDPDYSQHGNSKKQCHFHNDSSGDPGYYGNYLCDSPYNLVESVIEAMRHREAEPDFILWTGDTVPHVEQKSLDDVLRLISNVTTVLKDAFPNTSLVPLLGNHDAFPSNQMPLVESGTHYYDDILTKGDWSQLLEKQEQAQFQKGGYYSRIVQQGLRLVVLNSNLWYSMNKKVTGNLDPNQQLAWLRQQLTDAETAQQKVYIVAHICPGTFERLQGMSWFYPEFNKRYLDLITEHATTIAAHFCGHEHTDSFRLVKDTQGITTSLMYLSPALTPWKSPLPGVGANNPSVRLYHYSRSTSNIMDYLQYYLNLTLANEGPGNSSGWLDNSSGRLDNSSEGEWQLEYQATQAYAVTDCSPSNFSNLTGTFHTSSILFKRYMDYNTVSYNNSAMCGHSCFINQLCAILYVDINQYNNCMFWSGTTPKPHTHNPTPTYHPTNTPIHTTTSPPHTTTHHKKHHKPYHLPQYVFYIIGGMGLLIVALAVAVSCLCVRRRRRGMPFKYSHFVGPINS